MNETFAEATASMTFVVRFWREWTGAEARWRGRVEHVQSGQQVNFLEIEDLLGFFQHFGIDPAARTSGRIEDSRSAKDS